MVQRTGPTQVDSNSDTSPVDEALLDALEDDLRIPQRRIRRTQRRVCPNSEGHHQRGGLASTLEGDVRCSSVDATTVAASSNAVREAHVEFCESVHRICTDTESSTEEIRMPTRVPGRLVLTSGSLPVTQVRAPDNHDERFVPAEQENAADSHEERFARVRQTIQHEWRQIAAVEQFIRTVVERVGPINPEMDIPRRLRRLQWSALNVPLMWSAAEGNRQCAILEWLASRAEQLPPMNFCGEQVPGREVATIGWEVLHNAMRSRVSQGHDREVISADACRRGSSIWPLPETFQEPLLNLCTSTLSCTGYPTFLKVSSQCVLSMSHGIFCHHALRGKCWTTSIWRKSFREGSTFFRDAQHI